MNRRELIDVERIQDEPLIEMIRGNILENVHRGRVSVVSVEDGKAVYSLGDDNAPTFVRSTAKPIQAIASLLDGTAEAYGFEESHLALLAASHRGTKEQIDVLEQILALTGVDEDSLAVQPGYPVGRAGRDRLLVEGYAPRKLFHTCAGKHLGVLAWCKLKGWSLEGYIHPDHPAQREILARIEKWSDSEAGQVTLGRDGCGFPVAAMPLSKLALAYGRLANPGMSGDNEAADVVNKITSAMNANPELVEGPKRLASLLLSDPNVVAKSGAHGVFTFGLRKQKLGVAIAITDGTEVAWPYVAMSILKRFGGISPETKHQLELTFPEVFINDAKEVAGSWKAVMDNIEQS
ncbi:MAG: asparaginase [Candidatus Cohnella colombiensis]|uniref:Asparaginase n=1 Tax=Candidatus Cohnella colombiensis TaxID=3121368 RepID=A0AA95JC32_9BACL|nr:MAG: asparaginase [Cohnella sp.]